MKNQPTTEEKIKAFSSEIPIQFELLKQDFEEKYKNIMILIKELEKVVDEI